MRLDYVLFRLLTFVKLIKIDGFNSSYGFGSLHGVDSSTWLKSEGKGMLSEYLATNNIDMYIIEQRGRESEISFLKWKV